MTGTGVHQSEKKENGANVPNDKDDGTEKKGKKAEVCTEDRGVCRDVQSKDGGVPAME